MKTDRLRIRARGCSDDAVAPHCRRGQRCGGIGQGGCCFRSVGGLRSNGVPVSVAIIDFDLTEGQRAIKKTAPALAPRAMMPFARQWDEDEVFPVDTLREAAALALGGIYVAADVGGSALSRLDAVLIFEELAQGCPSTAAYLSIHNMVAWMIDAYGSKDL